MINKTYLHPIRTSDYFNSVLTFHPLSNEISTYSILKLSLLSSIIFYSPPLSPKNLLTPFNWRQRNWGKKLIFRSEFHIA